MNDLTPTERQAAMILDLEARLELANERIFFIASQNAKLLSALTQLLSEQEAQTSFTRDLLASVQNQKPSVG
jgi:hypothetical protein